MGVQIVNKDVSVISQIIGKAKANLSNVMGAIGWSGGGAVDVTPNPTPDWGDYIVGAPAISATQTIQGINTTINLYYECVFCGDGGNLYYSKNSEAWTIISELATISIVNNDTLAFKFADVSGGILSINIINASDSNAILDTLTFDYSL